MRRIEREAEEANTKKPPGKVDAFVPGGFVIPA